MPRKRKLTEKERKELERQKQADAEKERLLENERARAKLVKEEKQNALRKVMLDLTLKHFDKIKEHVKVVREKEKEEKMWRKYLDPEATPDPANPAKLRSYLCQWELDEEKRSKKDIDARLMLDDRSLLSQDVSTIDKRIKNFQATRKPIGDEFLPRIKQILAINSEISDFLKESGANLSDSMYNDLKCLQLLFRKQLSAYLDKWSFKILSDIDRDMTLLDPITAEYNYESNIINQFLWTFREVPLPPNYTKVNFVAMTACKTEFTKSNIMDLGSQCIRGLFLKYDHLSDYSSTYKIVVSMSDTCDLKTELENEQNILVELTNKKLENMKENRRLFEEEKKRLDEEGALVAKKGPPPMKKDKNEKPKKSLKRKTKKIVEVEEPPEVNDDTVIDVSEEFSTKLQENFLNEKEKLDPVYLDLENDEMNLREMAVLSGNYSFHLLQRPRQSRVLREDFIITLIDEPDILQYQDFFYDYVESPKPRLSLMHLKNIKRQSIFPKSIDVRETVEKRRTTLYIQERRTTALNQELEEEEKRWVSENELNQKKLFELRIKMCDDVYWWEPPSVCRWESWEESDAFKELSPAMQNYNLNYERMLEEQQENFFAAPPVKRDFTNIKRLQDTKLSEVKTVLPSHYLIKDYLLPRMIDDYKFAGEIRDDAEKEMKEKENRLRLRKESIERERTRMIEELQSDKTRESRMISFVEQTFVEIATQTDSEILTEMQKNDRKGRLSSKRTGISLESSEATDNARKSVATQTSSTPNSSKKSSKTSSLSIKSQNISKTSNISAEADDGSQTSFIVEARSSFIPSFVQVIPEKTPPKFLFGPKRRLKPLEVVQQATESESLQSIKLKDLIFDGFDENNTTLSKFLAYLEELHEKEKPFFHTDSYIDRFLAKLEAKKAESMADEAAKKLKDLKHQLRMSKLLEARERESTFYRVPRKSIAEVSKSKVWNVSSSERKKRRKTKAQKMLSGSVKEEFMPDENINKDEVKRPVSESNIEEELSLIPHFPGKWSKKHVHCETFDPDSKTITFKAGSFGHFGLFTSKYVNFPFKYWEAQPNSKEQEVTLTLEVKYTTVEFKISTKGFKVGIFLKTKSFLTELVPLIDDYTSFQTLVEKMRSVNVNVFPEPDACYYINKVSEKLGSLEEHCYKCLSMFCLTHAFKSSHWNRYLDYRSVLLHSKHLIAGNYREVFVSPSKSEFVHVSQKCTENLYDVYLRFTPNPPHQDFNPDLYNLLMGEIISSRKLFENTDPMLQWNVFELLSNLKILSFTK